MQGYDTLVNALEARFDYHSARVIAREAVAGAGLADRPDWTDEDLALAASNIASVGKDLGPVFERLGLEPQAASPPTKG